MGLGQGWLLRRLLERGADAGAGGAAKFWAARAWATHCWIIALMSGAGGMMVGLVTMLGSEAVSEIVGGVMTLCCSCSTKRDSCLSFVWALA